MITIPPDRRAILEERARRLARRSSSSTLVAGVDVLTFSLARERFAVASSYVFAVFPLAELVPLPGATPPVVGLTRWRGDVLTVLDLRRLVSAVSTALDDLGRVIVLGDEYPAFGVLADTVSDIVTIDPSTLFPPSDGRGADSGVLAGVTHDAMHVLDAKALLARQADVHATLDSAAVPSNPPTQ